jgi:hypothetical protein
VIIAFSQPQRLAVSACRYCVLTTATPRRIGSGAEALIEMYLAGVSVRRVEDITEDIELLKNQQMR